MVNEEDLAMEELVPRLFPYEVSVLSLKTKFFPADVLLFYIVVLLFFANRRKVKC